MIGKVSVERNGQLMDISLGDDGSVLCADPSIKRLVEIKLGMYNETYSPAEGAYGVSFLYDLAKTMRGRVSIEPKHYPEEDNLIY